MNEDRNHQLWNLLSLASERLDEIQTQLSKMRYQDPDTVLTPDMLSRYLER